MLDPTAFRSASRSSWRARSSKGRLPKQHAAVDRPSRSLLHDLIDSLTSHPDPRVISALAHRQESEGWKPPSVATDRRPLAALCEEIDAMARSSGGSRESSLSGEECSRPWECNLTSGRRCLPGALGDVCCTGKLPTVLCSTRARSLRRLQATECWAARAYLRPNLFPAGVQRWGDADFLRANLKQHRCHVLVSSATSKPRFKYWRDETNPAGNDRVPGDYEFSPPVKLSTWTWMDL